MAKAMRLMEENLSLCDAVLFVLDARAPVSSYNPNLKKILKNKPVCFLFNKADLADERAELLCRALKKEKNALLLSAVQKEAKKILLRGMEELVEEKAKKLKEKGNARALRFLVSGVPNTGKSTVINALSGEKKAKVGNKAGVTKTKQWVRCGKFELMDTPGTMPPSLSDQALARRLAYLGCINDDILSFEELARDFLSELFERYPERLFERYEIEPSPPDEALRAIAIRRGFKLKGDEFDDGRAAIALFDDFRKGKLGKMCLDSLDDLKKSGMI